MKLTDTLVQELLRKEQLVDAQKAEKNAIADWKTRVADLVKIYQRTENPLTANQARLEVFKGVNIKDLVQYLEQYFNKATNKKTAAYDVLGFAQPVTDSRDVPLRYQLLSTSFDLNSSGIHPTAKQTEGQFIAAYKKLFEVISNAYKQLKPKA